MKHVVTSKVGASILVACPCACKAVPTTARRAVSHIRTYGVDELQETLRLSDKTVFESTLLLSVLSSSLSLSTDRDILQESSVLFRVNYKQVICYNMFNSYQKNGGIVLYDPQFKHFATYSYSFFGCVMVDAVIYLVHIYLEKVKGKFLQPYCSTIYSTERFPPFIS